MSQDSLEDEHVEGLSEISDALLLERAKRKRELLFDSIENDSKRLPPSKRKRLHILPKSPTDSDEREKIIIPKSTNTTELQPVSTVPIEPTQAESSNSEKNEKSEQKNQPRRSSRKKNTVKLNKVNGVKDSSV